MPNPLEFRTELKIAINRAAMEWGSDTPDFILAEYLAGCLEVFDKALAAREKWYGRTLWIKEDPAKHIPRPCWQPARARKKATKPRRRAQRAPKSSS